MALFVISLLTVSMVSAEATTLGNLDDATYGNVLVKVNDEELDNTLLTVDKGEELEIEVELSIINNLDSTDDSAKNIEVEARLMGYDEEDVEDSVLVKKSSRRN